MRFWFSLCIFKVKPSKPLKMFFFFVWLTKQHNYTANFKLNYDSHSFSSQL